MPRERDLKPDSVMRSLVQSADVDDDEVEIAADDAGATAAMEKLGKAEKEEPSPAE